MPQGHIAEGVSPDAFAMHLGRFSSAGHDFPR